MNVVEGVDALLPSPLGEGQGVRWKEGGRKVEAVEEVEVKKRGAGPAKPAYRTGKTRGAIDEM